MDYMTDKEYNPISFDVNSSIKSIEDDNSDDEINLEITDNKNGNIYTHIYSVPYKPSQFNKKRLICFSAINDEKCCYGNNCTYAHSLEEQQIDDEKKFIYQIILDKILMNFFSMTNPKTDEIYKQLLFLTNICESCLSQKCTGGYNCRNGINNRSLKICKNDLLTGECLNKILNIQMDDDIIKKISSPNFRACEEYKGCLNGHHLTLRNLIPYYKYIHMKDNSRKYKYQSVRYIDINPLQRLFKHNIKSFNSNCTNDYSDSSTDEEINGWFQKKNIDSDDE